MSFWEEWQKESNVFNRKDSEFQYEHPTEYVRFLEEKLKKLGEANKESETAYSLLGEIAPYKKVFEDESFNIKCGNCDTHEILRPYSYCPNCGIKLDWRNFA